MTDGSGDVAQASRVPLTRITFSRRHVAGSGKSFRLRPAAFLPHRGTMSVFRIDGLDGAGVWKHVGKHALHPGKRMHGRGDFRLADMRAVILKLDLDESPPRHGNVVGWPPSPAESPQPALDSWKSAGSFTGMKVQHQVLTTLRTSVPRVGASPLPEAPEGPPTVGELEALEIGRVTRPPDRAIWNTRMNQAPPRGGTRLAGAPLKYLIKSKNGYLGALGFHPRPCIWRPGTNGSPGLRRRAASRGIASSIGAVSGSGPGCRAGIEPVTCWPVCGVGGGATSGGAIPRPPIWWRPWWGPIRRLPVSRPGMSDIGARARVAVGRRPRRRVRGPKRRFWSRSGIRAGAANGRGPRWTGGRRGPWGPDGTPTGGRSRSWGRRNGETSGAPPVGSSVPLWWRPVWASR